MSAKDALARSEKYLESANMLIRIGDYASSVSRSYYAMFFVARALLQQIDVETKTHSGLRNQFGLHFVKSGRVPERFSQMLDTAEDLRALAEYAEEPGVVTEEDARSTLDDARTFVKAMRERMDQA